VHYPSIQKVSARTVRFELTGCRETACRPCCPLVCRGSDVRALKGFVAAALCGRDVTFVPMIKGAEGYCGSQLVLDPKGLALSDANAIARYLGGGTGAGPGRSLIIYWFARTDSR